MPLISNKTQRPLSVPLPRGKSLHLGPGKTGDVASSALAHTPLKALIDAGEIEVVDDGPRSVDRAGGGNKGRGWTGGPTSAARTRRSGDR